MEQYIGLDVSLKETAISVRQGGIRIWRGKCASDPRLLAEIIRKQAPHVERAVFETGPLATWFYHALTAEGVPAICVEARHAHKILNETLNKTDANDADGLAQLAEAGFYKVVRVKTFDAMLTRSLVGIRKQVVGIAIRLSNQIRGVMKTFGLVVPKGKGRVLMAMSADYWKATAIWHRSSSLCSTHGVTFVDMPLILIDNCWQPHGKARPRNF